MLQKTMPLPELILLVSTRAAFGAGIGLLVSEKLNRDTRRGAGWALVAIGAITTVPLAMGILGKPEPK